MKASDTDVVIQFFFFLFQLDKTYTGLQTLGAETTVDIEIEREDMPAATITKPLPQATSTPVPMQQEQIPNKRTNSDNLCTNGRKSLDSSGNSVDSDAQNGGIPKRCGSEISDNSMESDSLGGVFSSNKQMEVNGLKRTSSLSSNISSSSELFSLDRRKTSMDDWSASNSCVPSATAMSPSDMSVPTLSRGTTPDYSSVKIKQEPMDETPACDYKSRRPKISLNLTEVPFLPPSGIRIKTEPFDMDDVGSTVTTPDSGIGIRPEPMDLSIDGGMSLDTGIKIKSEIPETLDNIPSSLPSFESSSNESLTTSNVLAAPPVPNNNTSVHAVDAAGSTTVNKSAAAQMGKVPNAPVVPSPAQNLYIKCVDPQGNLCLIPQHLLMKSPQATSIGKPVASPLQTGVKTGTGQNVMKSPASNTLQMLIPAAGITPRTSKARASMPVVRPTDPSFTMRGTNVSATTLQPGNVVLRATPTGSNTGTQKGPIPKLQPAPARLFLDPTPAVPVVGKPEPATISSRLKPPGSVSLLNRSPSLATGVKNSVPTQPGLVTMGTNVVRQPSPGKPGKGASVPQTPVLTLKNLSPNPPTSINVNSVPAESCPMTGSIGQNPNVLTITSQSSPVPSATGPPPTAQLVKANIGGKLVWLQLFPNQKSGANKAAKALTDGARIKTEIASKTILGNKAGTKTNPESNITITMGTGNYQTTSQKKQSSLLKPGSQNYIIKNNSIFHQESGISSMKTLPKEQWVKYRQKRVDEVKQAEKPVK
jgi:hypothetical protein